MKYPSVLILGGARSGKSVYAEHLTCLAGEKRVYLATAEAWDTEMKERIEVHQARRDESWQTLEVSTNIFPIIAKPDPRPLLVDCLSLWLSNLMHLGYDLEMAFQELVNAIGARPVIFVSNEVGLSITPDNALARRFQDAQGVLNQTIAANVDYVAFIAAGIPLDLKGSPPWK